MAEVNMGEFVRQGEDDAVYPGNAAGDRDNGDASAVDVCATVDLFPT